MTTYNPESRSSREALAVALLVKLTECGFELVPETETCKEAVYRRTVDGTDGRIVVRVYTSVVSGARGPEVREAGSDAIRVCAIYIATDKRERGIVSAEHRVNRVGQIEDIVERMYLRMREVYGLARTGCRCDKCGAPLFQSKKKNPVCAELCWLPPEKRNTPSRPPPRRASPPRGRRRRWGVYR